MKLRIKFTKHGTVRYIGHLDLQRYFQRVNRRAGIHVVYSEGFSPHQKMSFAMPLSVGYESDAEYFDIEVSEAASSADIISALNRQQTEGIEVLSCVLLPEKCENAMASVRAAKYTVSFRDGFGPEFDIRTAVTGIMDSDSFIVKKIDKKNRKKARISKASYNTKTMHDDTGTESPDGTEYIETDIRPYIYEMYVDESMAVHIKASAGSKNNIRPDTVIGAMFESSGQKLSPNSLIVTRNELYTYAEDGSTLIPLSEAGTQF